MKKVLRLYISNEVSKTVAKSQMLNWADTLVELGIETWFCVFCKTESIKEMQSTLLQNKHDVIFIAQSNSVLMNHLKNWVKLTKIIRENLSKYGKIVIQTRTQSFAVIFFLLRCFYKKVTLITDFRGSRETDYDYLINVPLSKKIKLNFYDFWEKLQLKSSHHVIVVSNVLRDYLTRKHKLPSDFNFATIPGNADNNYFFFSNKLREEIRNKYNLMGKTVYIYSGMIDKEWQVPKIMFSFFRTLHKCDLDSFIIVLTPNIKIASELSKFHGLHLDRFVVMEVLDYTTLNEFYNAADVGILFREDRLVNNVASPTKFAEYVMSGLRVILTEGIGDYSELVSRNNWGLIIPIDMIGDDGYCQKLIDDLSSITFLDRSTISEIATATLSKHSALNIYKGLFS